MSPTELPAAAPRPDLRLAALRRFALAITVFNVLGHLWFGFEQSVAQPLVALGTAYALDLLLEALEAWLGRRPPRFAGGPLALANFLLPAHITGLAVAMLLYANDRLAPIAFATAAAIASKYLFRAAVGGRSRHFFNPSNFGITLTLLAFPWVGIAPPYMFSENLDGWGDWILPALIICSGTFLNARFTRRMPLIAAWLGAFALQALIRALVFGTPPVAGLVPMTGVAFVLYTFYMVSDPGTTPFSWRGQVAFGAAVAAAYGVLLVFHVVFGLFFALTAVCTLRGLGLWARDRLAARERSKAPVAVAEDGRLRA
jgi:enediyne biosynthesis protein E5